LPDGGILFMVAHDNGQICKWAEYASIFDVTKPNKKKGRTPTYIKCPNCGELGRLNWAYDKNAKKEERPFTFKYIVVHEIIPGSWGKENVKRRRRCQSFTEEQRIEILKQIGRYISDPPKPNSELKKIENDIESQLQKIDENQNLKVSNNNISKNNKIDSHKEALVELGQENFQSQINQDRSIQYKGVVPRGKRLTICTKCNKPGYKYQTYFQHYNEPPVGKVMLKGKVIGDRYRRCNIINQKIKQDNIVQKANSELYPREIEKSKIDTILKELSRYIEESYSILSKEDETGKDYKKMYWDLIEKMSKILYEIKKPTFV
jgi:hypothetical protein